MYIYPTNLNAYNTLPRYDLQIKDKEGSKLYRADTLSRAYLNETGLTSKFCMQLDQTMSNDWSNKDTNLDEIGEATCQDEELQCVS